MPAFPETCRVGGLIGRVEVERQVESHKHGHAYRYVGIAAEVGIDLQGIDHQRREILERGEEGGVIEHPVHEVYRQVVGEDYLLEKAVEYPEHRDTELPAGEEEGLVELGDELVGPDDGACHQLREEGGVESEIEDIGGVAHFAFIDIDDIAYVLERVERDAYRQEYHRGVETCRGGEVVGPARQDVHRLEMTVEDGVIDVGEEVGVLKIAQHQEVEHHADNHQQPSPLAFLMLTQAVHPYAQQPAEEGGKDEQHHKQSRGLVIEKQAYQEEVAVAHKPPGLAHRRPFARSYLHDGAERYIDDEEERPEVELGEQQRMAVVEGEEVSKIRTEHLDG